MIIEESILINADLKKVWETFTNLTCWKDWNSVIRNVKSQNKCIEAGCKLSCSFRPFFFPIKATIEIKEVKPAKSICWQVKKIGLLAEHVFDFQKKGKETQVISRETFNGFVVKNMSFIIPRQKIINLTKSFLGDLKAASEQSI